MINTIKGDLMRCNCNKKLFLKNGYVPFSAFCKCKKAENIIKKPLNIFLSNNKFAELSPIGTEIGVFTTNKRKRGIFILYSEYVGQNDNDKFYIQNNKLKTKKVLSGNSSGTEYVVTVKYVSYLYEKIQNFTVELIGDYNLVESGENVQTFSQNNNVEITFENLTSSGKVFFNEIELETTSAIFYDIETSAELEGNITICFNNPNISTINNPSIVQIKYDVESETIRYENVTTEVYEGRMCATVNSLGPFLGFFDFIDPNIWDSVGSLSVPKALVTDEQLGCDIHPEPAITMDSSPCPGGQTKGNWAITERGVGLPRLLGGTCGCWQPSFFTVDMILAAGTAAFARRGACRLLKNIFDYRALIKQLDDSILEIRNGINALRQVIREATDQISNIRSKIDDFTDQLQRLVQNIEGLCLGGDAGTAGPDDFICPQLDNLVRRIDDLQEELIEKYGAVPLGDDLGDPLVQAYRTAISNKEDLAQRVQNARDLALDRGGKIRQAEQELDSAINTLNSNNNDLLDQELNLATKENIKSGYLDSLNSDQQSLWSIGAGTAMAALELQSYLTEISVKKQCGSNQTLNEYTCECCDNCTGGKVFIDISQSCSCVCPPDKEPCLAVGNESCYDPCPSGKIRVGGDCQCKCINGESDCSPDQIFNEETCSCECPPDKEPCLAAGNQSCYDPCPSGKIRVGSDCQCKCIDPSQEECGHGCFDPCPQGKIRPLPFCEPCECANSASECGPDEVFDDQTCACNPSEPTTTMMELVDIIP